MSGQIDRAGDDGVIGARILYVVNDAGFFLSHRLPVARAALNAGAEVHVATTKGRTAEIEEQGFRFHEVDFTRSGTNVLREAGTIYSLWRLYRTLRPELVHHVTVKPIIYGCIAQRFGPPAITVNAVTGLGFAFYSRSLRAALLRRLLVPMYGMAFKRRGSRTIFQNQDDQRRFVQSGAVAKGNAVVIRGSGVDMTQFVPSPEPAGVPLVVLPSRMLWSKGVGDFVEAVTLLRQKGVRARFALVGGTDPGNPTAVPRDVLRKWSTSGTVEWWGHQSDMPAVFREAHIVCLPSAYGEGVPKVLIEAAASGRPVITTNLPGCNEIVRDGVNGLLVPVHDPRALARGIEEMLGQPDVRRQMGQCARRVAEEGFSVEEVIARTMAVYRDLLEAGRS